MILGAWAAPVQAEERVVLIEDSEQAGSGLAYALRIQLTGVAGVEERKALETNGVSARVRAASELAQEADVLLVVWVEPTVELEDGSREAVLYVVGHKQGRALIEVVRVPGGEGPDVDRSLALKVRELVDEVRHNREQAAASDLTLEPAAEPAPSEVGSGLGLRVAVGAVVGPLSGSEVGQWGAQLEAGPAWRGGSVRVSLLAALAIFPELQISAGESQVRVFELSPALLAHAQVRQSTLWVGLHTGLGLSVIEAQARTPFGPGEASELAGSWLVGADVELPLGQGLGIAASVDLQTRLKRQRFSIAEQEVVDSGRFRPVASIAFTWTGAAIR